MKRVKSSCDVLRNLTYYYHLGKGGYGSVALVCLSVCKQHYSHHGHNALATATHKDL